MPLTSDPHTIRAILRGDPAWAVYMLADLAPPYWEHTEWHAAGGAVLLLYRGFDLPVLVAHGPEEDVRGLLGEICEERMYLSVRPEVLGLLEGAGYRIEESHEMLRMALDPGRFQPPEGCTERLGLSDLGALRTLYADGEAFGEAPPFFSEATLEHGVYHGIREGAELVAAAGTHVFTPEEDVAGIGNVYTRRDRRGRGLGGRVTAAVVSELVARGVGTIALNVAANNAAAVRVYERLGFQRYCGYFEGRAALGAAS